MRTEAQPKKRVPILFVLAALASLLAGFFHWRSGDLRDATVSLAVAVAFGCMAGMQRRPALAWPAWGAMLFAGALVAYGFLT